MREKKLKSWFWSTKGLQEGQFKLTDEPSYKEVPVSGVIPAGTSVFYKTGGWRNMRPAIKIEKCNRCGLCWVYCPEGAIQPTADGYEIDLDFCKGCGICEKECKLGAIEMVEEI